jgi:hypothetical protein
MRLILLSSRILVALVSAALLVMIAASGTAYGAERDDVRTFGQDIASQEGPWDTRETQIDINGQPFKLILRHFPGDVAWADRVQSITPQAIPAIQAAIGVNYPGPPTLRVTERTGPEMYGAAGIAQCNTDICALAIGEDSEAEVLLHEIAHVWTYSFKNRWLAEGTAEFAAVAAAGSMGVPIRFPLEGGNRLPAYPLDHWGSFAGFDEGTYETELEGYDRSTRFLQLLQSRNPTAMAAAYGALVGKPQISVESEQFMDAMEDAGGGNNDDLFRAWIFGPEMQAAVADRRGARDNFGGMASRLVNETPELGQEALTPIRQTLHEWNFAQANEEITQAKLGIDAYLGIRDRLNAFRGAAEATGLAYPIPFDQARISLDYQTVAGQLDIGEEAIRAYPAARDAVQAERSTIQKIGLFGQDPDGDLEQVESDFAWARFDQSIEKGQQVQDTIKGAESAGVRNAVIGGVLLLLFVVVGLFAVKWALSAEEPEAAPMEG